MKLFKSPKLKEGDILNLNGFNGSKITLVITSIKWNPDTQSYDIQTEAKE